MPPNNTDTTKSVKLTNHNVMPAPDPDDACGSALSGG